MPAIKCPIPGCDFSTDDVEAAIMVQLLQLHQVIHAQPQGHPSTAKVEKVKRPSISRSGTSEEWSYFNTRWDEYVAATGIKGKDCVIQLLECCDEELRRDLTRSAGGSLTSKNEKTVLEAIKKLAIRVENVMVARVTLHEMHQDRDEPVRLFSARLKGQANICKFSVECPDCRKNIDYTDHIVHDCIIRGISDDDIRLDVLGNQNQDMNQDALVAYIESKEVANDPSHVCQAVKGLKLHVTLIINNILHYTVSTQGNAPTVELLVMVMVPTNVLEERNALHMDKNAQHVPVSTISPQSASQSTNLCPSQQHPLILHTVPQPPVIIKMPHSIPFAR